MSAPFSPGRKRAAPPPLALRNEAFEALAQPFVDAGVLRGDAARLLDLVAPRYGERDPAVLLALALALEAEERGHGAIDLARAEELLPPPERHGDPTAAASAPTLAEAAQAAPGGGRDDEPEDDEEDDDTPLADAPLANAAPATALRWDQVRAAKIAASPLVGRWEDSPRPFVLLAGEPSLVLTRRFADEQSRIARALSTLARDPAPAPVFDAAAREATLARFYPDAPDSQGARALGACLDGRLSVITGGPGTGKTFTVLRVLAALLAAKPDLRVALAAPTGKASVRMREAMAEDFEKLAVQLALDATSAEALKALKPSTVHKLLRIRPDTGGTRYDPKRPLPYDLVLVDEASMLDFTLMRKLLEALDPKARLVLLGDRDQLASVEAGTVLADIVAGALAGSTDALAARIVFFTRSFRFRDGPLVAGFASRVQSRPGEIEGSVDHRARLAAASGLLRGAVPALADMLLDDALAETTRETAARRAGGESAPDPARAPADALRFTERRDRQRLDKEHLATLAQPYLGGYVTRLAACGRTDADARAVLDAFDDYRILCTHRAGPRGVSGLNRAVGEVVRKEAEALWKKHGEQTPKVRKPRPTRADGTAGGATDKAGEGSAFPRKGGFWLGLPVLVTENSYDVGLFNGDIGLVLPGKHGGVEIVFPREKGSVQRVRVERLPPWLPAFALTVHKSQGSQFTEVAVVLSERRSPIETRELVYTGVTRAKKSVHLVGCAEGLDAALARPVGRVSALRAFLERELAGSPE
jgi:exodeoxyribonuclease V alpha subunit